MARRICSLMPTYRANMRQSRINEAGKLAEERLPC